MSGDEGEQRGAGAVEPCPRLGETALFGLLAQRSDDADGEQPEDHGRDRDLHQREAANPRRAPSAAAASTSHGRHRTISRRSLAGAGAPFVTAKTPAAPL